MGTFDTFPYSNQHNLNLDWIVRTVKEVMTSQDKLIEDFGKLKQDIKDYFDSLDISREIKDAVIDLAGRGELPTGDLKGLHGKTALFFGDSLTYGMLTGGDQAPDNIPRVFGDKTGATIINKGAPGCRAVLRPDQTEPVGYRLLIDVVSAAISDVRTADYIFLNIGTNDSGPAPATRSPMGHIGSTDRSTFVGEVRHVLSYIQSNMKTGCHLIVFTAPLTTTLLQDAYWKMGYQLSLAMIAESQNIPVIDLLRSNGVNGTTTGRLHPTEDATHFTNAGYKYFGELLYTAYSCASFFHAQSAPNIAHELTAKATYNSNNVSLQGFGYDVCSTHLLAGHQYVIKITATATADTQINMVKDLHGDAQRAYLMGEIQQSTEPRTYIFMLQPQEDGDFSVFIGTGALASISYFGISEFPGIPDGPALPTVINFTKTSEAIGGNSYLTARVGNGGIHVDGYIEVRGALAGNEIIFRAPRLANGSKLVTVNKFLGGAYSVAAAQLKAETDGGDYNTTFNIYGQNPPADGSNIWVNLDFITG